MPRLKKKWMPPAVPAVSAVPIAEPATAVVAPYVNLRNASRYSGLSRWALYDLIHSGRLPARRLGPGFIIRTADLDQLWQNAESASAVEQETGRTA